MHVLFLLVNSSFIIVIPENSSLINQFLVEIKNAPSSSHVDALELYDIAAPPPLFEIIPNSFMSVTAFG
jgi:hypothetical protein